MVKTKRKIKKTKKRKTKKRKIKIDFKKKVSDTVLGLFKRRK